jgi:hypothetical protein
MSFKLNFNDRFPEVCRVLFEITSEEETGGNSQFRLHNFFLTLMNGVHLSDDCKAWLNNPLNESLADAALFCCTLYPLLVTQQLISARESFTGKIFGLENFQKNMHELVAQGIQRHPSPLAIHSFMN